MTTPHDGHDGHDSHDSHDAREGSGDPTTDPAAAGERAAEQPDGDGGAVVDPEQR